MENEAISVWTIEQIQRCFLDEVTARFKKINDEWLAEEQAFIDSHPGENFDWMKEMSRPSFEWEYFQLCDFNFEQNYVVITLPVGYATRMDVLELFNHTEVAWSEVMVGATIVEDIAHPTADVLLVDYWDDERSRKWHADKT